MTNLDEGQDFASAVMMRLVAAGLARQGISVPLRIPSGARVPRSEKRDLLGEILTMHGPVAILSIADAARSMSPEPVAQALIRARDTGDLLERWHRLERFSHGRHTVETHCLGAASFRLTHRARDGGPPPSSAESLLVLALFAILAEMVVSADVSLATEAGDIWRENGAWRATAGTAAFGSLVLTAPANARSTCRHDALPAEGAVVTLRQQVVADPVRRWTLADLAAEAGVSPRTLQRRLAQRSVSFSRLIAEARLEVAASHLCNANGPSLSAIAFLAGFSDQAHFARSFNRAVGTSPRLYRTDFGQ